MLKLIQESHVHFMSVIVSTLQKADKFSEVPKIMFYHKFKSEIKKFFSQITRDNIQENLFEPRAQKILVFFFVYFDDTPPQNNTKLFLPGLRKIKYSLAHVKVR